VSYYNAVLFFLKDGKKGSLDVIYIVFENLKNKVSKKISAQKYSIQGLKEKNWLPIFNIVGKKPPRIEDIVKQHIYKQYRLLNETTGEILWQITNFEYQSEETAPKNEKHIDKNESLGQFKEFMKVFSEMKENIQEEKEELKEKEELNPAKRLLSQFKSMEELKKYLSSDVEKKSGTEKRNPLEILTEALKAMSDPNVQSMIYRMFPQIAPRTTEIPPEATRKIAETYMKEHPTTVPRPPPPKPQEQPKPQEPKPQGDQHD